MDDSGVFRGSAAPAVSRCPGVPGTMGTVSGAGERVRGPAVSTQRFVRPARAEDVEAIVDVQVAAWQEMYHALLPEPVLAEMAGAEARAAFTAPWRSAVSSPPTSRPRLLVAVVAGAQPGIASTRTVPGTVAARFAYHIAPWLTRRGHGSRLLHAVVDHLVDDGFHAVYVWTLEQANPVRSFLEQAGWAPDGARRELDPGTVVPMVRLHAAI